MLCQLANAEVHLPSIFSSHMILEQQRPIAVWGWDHPNQVVTVQLGTTAQKVQANQRGGWKTTLRPLSAGGPYTLTVSGSSTVTFEDVLVGKVWLCSGQSNMEMGIGQAQNGAQEGPESPQFNYTGVKLVCLRLNSQMQIITSLGRPKPW